MSAPDPHGPAGLPDLRIFLADRWRTGGAWDRNSRNLAMILDDPNIANRPERRWHTDHLKSADLWWVSPEMTDVVDRVARNLPSDIKPDEIECDDPLGTRAGLVLFGRPIVGGDSRDPSHKVTVNAVLFGPTSMGPNANIGRFEDERCVSISSYRRINFGDGLAPDELKAAMAWGCMTDAQLETISRKGRALAEVTQNATGHSWYPLGRSDWPLVDRLDEPIDREPQRTKGNPDGSVWLPDVAHASAMEDRRLLAALMLVSSERRLADRRIHRPDKGTWRRSERAGYESSVNVLYLRRVVEPGVEVDGDGTGRHVHCTYWVNEHQAWVWYGPGRTLRKRVLRIGHYRGQGPLKDGATPTVKGLVR